MGRHCHKTTLPVRGASSFAGLPRRREKPPRIRQNADKNISPAAPPSEILKQLRLSLKSAVSVSLDGNNIVIKAQPRQGWAEAAKRAHENGDDELLIPDVFEDEKFEDWTW